MDGFAVYLVAPEVGWTEVLVAWFPSDYDAETWAKKEYGDNGGYKVVKAHATIVQTP